MHTLRLQQTDQGLRVLATTKIVAKPQEAPVDFLDVQLPRLPLVAARLLGGTTGEPFPGGVLWPALALVDAFPVESEWRLAGGAAGELQDL